MASATDLDAGDTNSDKLTASRDARVSLALSFVIGALVGLIVVAFILLTGRLAARMYPPGSAAWRRVLTPIAGALISGYLLFRFFPDARGSGIPQTKYAIFLNDGLITLKTAMGKFLCCAISLASGIALGREGPSVQIGAGIASVLGRRFGLSKKSVRDLLPMGCAAALAAAFNTPIAAVLFTLEEVLGDLHAPVLGSIVISSATSWMLLHLILGDQPLFHVPAYKLIHPVEFLIYAVLGVAGGIGSVCFVKLLLLIRLGFRRFPRWTVWMQPAVGGIVVGLLGLYLPEVLGVGYDYVERVLGGDLAIRTVVLLIFLKIVATAVCYSSGNAGGIFGPSLFIGAMIGGAVGSVAHYFFPAVTAGPGAYALVGMGATFAGIIRTPLTSVIMIFELTRDYTIIVPVMIANLIAFIISYRLQRQPIYEALAHQDGIFLPTEERGASGPTVGNVMRPLDDTSVDEARALASMQQAGVRAWPLVDNGCMTAMIDRDSVRLDSKAFVHSDHSLNVALERMGAAKVDVLPVVSRVDRDRVVGIITMPDLLAAYGVGQSRL
jgi:CIC family chloride channel protein